MARHRKTVIRYSSCKDLVLADSSRLKAEEQKKCRALYRKIESLQARLDLHENRSAPEFQKWLYSKFGRELTQSRDLGSKMLDLQRTVDAVFTESLRSGEPESVVYDNLLRAQNRKKQKQRQSDAERENEYIRSLFVVMFGPEDEWQYEDRTYEEVFAVFKADYISKNTSKNEEYSGGDYESEEEEEAKARARARAREKKPEPSPAAASKNSSHETRIREIYRQMARTLHPDLNPQLDRKQIELWHQVQEAYETRNLAQLETLVALGEMQSQSSQPAQDLAPLRNLFRELGNALKQLEKKMRGVRGDISWNFHEKLKDLAQMRTLERSVRAEFASDHRELETRLNELSAIIEEWTQPRRQKSGRRSKRNFSAFEVFKSY